jgi:hypothetical protein
MKKYTIDAMNLYGLEILKGRDIATFTDKEDAWDYVGMLDERFPQGHFVVVEVEK